MDRLSLHSVFLSITPYVYYQPPENLKLEYPCIIYERDILSADYANNAKYANSTRYQVTVIDRDPDSEILQTVNQLPKCKHQRQFVTDGLNHDIFELYY